MILNFTGASPLKSAEWALVPWFVYFPSMPLELLDPSEFFLATGRFQGRFHLGAHTTLMRVIVGSGISDSWMFSSSQRRSLCRINMRSNHGRPKRAYLAGWRIVLRAQLDVKRQSRSNRGHRESVVEVQRSRGFISMTQCWPFLIVPNGYFSGQVRCRGSRQRWTVLWITKDFFELSVRPKRH